MNYALGAAFFFAWSVTCARRSSAYHGPDLANLGRITLAFIIFSAWILFSHRHPFCTGWSWLLLGGALGLGVGDIALFHALPRIGAGLSMLLMQCLAAPFALIIEYLTLGHIPTQTQLVCSLIILVGVVLALGAPTDGMTKHWRLGVGLAILAALGQASGAVSTPLAKSACAAAGESIPDGIAQAWVRLLGGFPIVALFVLSRNPGKALWSRVQQPYDFKKAPWWVLMNALAGPGLGVACYQWALTGNPAAVVLSIVALSPLIALVMQWAIEGTRPSLRLWIGGAIAITGVILLKNT
jgi:drug/metabolite transporter (DMT)-like permease